MKHLLYTFCFMASLGSVAMAQEAPEQQAVAHAQKEESKKVDMREIKGRVFDSATKQPVAGISVAAYNDARYAAMTDDKGEYIIKVPTYVTSLLFKAEGYSMAQVAVNKTGEGVDALMYSDRFTQIYSPATNAKSHRTELVDYNNNDISIDNQIQTKLGGEMLTTTRSGVPGMGINMLMNGINSLNINACPLVVIDGVIMDMQEQRTMLHDGFYNNLLSNIMVEDIEKVSVLRNGTALYGAKAANGVLVIETKRNKSMATKIDVSIGGSYELLPKSIDVLGAEDYRLYASEMIRSTGTQVLSFPFLNIDPNYYYYKVYHNNTDWQKTVKEEAFTQNYSINVQGGDDVANYNLSVGYASADATLKNNSFSRFNMRLNSDIILGKGVSVRFDAAYSDVTRDMRDDGIPADFTNGGISSPGFLSLIKAPFLSPYDYDAKGNLSSFYAPEDDYLSGIVSYKRYRESLANPLSILHYGDGDNKNYFGNRLITLAISPKYEINRNWTIGEHFSFQLTNTDENYYLPMNGVPDFDYDETTRVQNRAGALAARHISFMSDTYAAFNRRFNAHMLSARAGFRYLRSNYQLNTQVGYNTGNDKTPNMNKGLQNKSTDGTIDEEIDLTYYLTADYNYRERYYLSAGASMDGSSKYGKDAGMSIGNYGWGLFPSVQAAWVMTNENWFNFKPINYMKLNVGYDMVGNDNIDNKASRSYFVSEKVWDKTTGLVMGNIGNTKLQWETTHRFTAGLQLAAFQNRLGVDVNFFHSKTTDLLGYNALSYVSGLEKNWINGGELTNTGVNATFNVKVLDLKDWKWGLGASLGHYKNEVKSLPNIKGGSYTTDVYGATILTQEGSAAGLFYGYKTNGVFATTAQAKEAGKYLEDERGTRTYFAAGDMNFVDVDDNKEINEKDMQVIGDPNPDLYGTIFTNLSWKRLQLDVTFNYSLGNDIYNYQRSVLESGSRFQNQTKTLLARWTTEGQVTDIPRLSYGDAMGNSRFSDRWIEDGSYLRLKNVTLSYHLPIRSTYLQGLTFWGAAYNLVTFTKYLGTDPETCLSNSVYSRGIDRGLLSQGRSFAVGMKINL